VSAQRPFRFWTDAAPIADARRLPELARRAEALGYDAMLVADHLVDMLAPIPAMAAIAVSTERLRFAGFVLNNDLRHPALLAHELLTLDHLSRGRLIVGIGAGWNQAEYRAAGIQFDRHPVRAARLAESIAVIKAIFRGDSVDHDGEHYRVRGFADWSLPVQRPHPPFLVGAGGRRVLELAAREAQVVGLAPRLDDPESMLAPATDEKLAWIRAAAGERFDALEINTYTSLRGGMEITNRPLQLAREISRRIRERWAVDIDPKALLESPHVLLGSVDEIVERCQALRERWGISVIAVPGPDEFAPVVERLAGR
jgi:probable F420-dependent oxidoreductase